MSESFIKPNPIYYVTDNYSYWDYLSSDNAQLARIAGLGLALILGVLGVIAIIDGHRILPRLFASVREQYGVGGGILLASAASASIAFAIPKIVTEVKERKVRNFLLKNYVLIGTNLTIKGKNLRKLLKEAKIIALTEKHNSEEIRQKNKFVIENLWKNSSLFLSESQVSSLNQLLLALEIYKLDCMKIHRAAWWDIEDKNDQKLVQKLEILARWAQHLLELKKEILNGEAPNDKKTYFTERDFQICPEILKLGKLLDQIFSDTNKESALIELFNGWFSLKNNLITNLFAWLREKHSLRQSSLSNHAIHYAKDHQVLLVAGTHHLAMNKNQKWTTEELLEQNLKNKNIPYLIMHAHCQKMTNNQTIFWQDFKDESLKDMILPNQIVKVEAANKIASKENGITEENFQQKLAEYQNWKPPSTYTFSDITDYMDLATFVLEYEFEILKKNIAQKNT